MNGTPTQLSLPDATHPQPHDTGWSRRKLVFIIFLAFLIHVALICSFGAKTLPMRREVSNVPEFHVASRSDELVALRNPALFALPNPRDFASAVWLKAPEITPPSFRWTESPRWLPLSGKDLGAVFSQYMQTNAFITPDLAFKSMPAFTPPMADATAGLPVDSTFQISHNLARRELLYQPALPLLPYNDVIAPTRVLILVDATGNVVSAVVLPPGNSLESSGHLADADNKALILAKSLRFKIATENTVGEVTFYWRTTPLVQTNLP